MIVKDDDYRELASYPKRTGFWMPRFSKGAEIEAFQHNGMLVAARDDLDDAAIQTDELDGCEDAFQYISVESLRHEDDDEAWERIPDDLA